MIRHEVTGRNGKLIIELIPETEADIAELERMAEQQDIDQRDSFADDPRRLAATTQAGGKQ